MRRFLFFAMGVLGGIAGEGAALAQPLPEYYRGARQTAMGGAHLGLSDDASTLFLNPAGLAGLERGEIIFPSAFTSVSTDSILFARNAISGLSGFGVDTISALMGQNHSLQTQLSTSLTMPNVGFGYVFNNELGILAQNQALPSFTLISMETHVFQGGFAFSIGKKRRGKFELRIGATGKAVLRKGGYRAVPFADLLSLSLPYLQSLVGDYGFGLGFDLGVQMLVKVSREWTLFAGSAFTNIGDIAFASGAMPMRGNLGAGIGARYMGKSVSVQLAWDLRHLTAETAWALRNHLGLEVALPFISFYGGLYQVYPTGGIGLNFWLIKLVAATFVTETGGLPYQDPERRWVLGLTFRIPL